MYKIILMIDFAEEYSKGLLKGIAKYSKEHGPWVFCRMPLFQRETKGMGGIFDWALEWGADGIIGQFYNDPQVSLFIDAGIPIIAQDFKERFKEIPNITGQHFNAGVIGADYFLQKGFKNFAFYGFSNIVWSRERSDGYEHRINEAGYKVHYFENEITYSGSTWYYKPSSLSQWLKSLPKPIALMACDDNQGQHITEACRLAGINIPQEVAVLGVDNDEMVCEFSDPPLSSVAQDTERGGYMAAALLEKMIKNGTKDFYDVIINPTHIVTRQSSDIYATNDNNIATALKYIHQNIDKDIHVNDLLKEVPLSRRSLEIKFQEITGLAIYKYISNLRMDKFSTKLLETDQSVFEIALDMGLSDSKNLSRQFKAIKGCTPSEYRKRYSLKKMPGNL